MKTLVDSQYIESDSTQVPILKCVTGYEQISGDCIADSSCSKPIDLETYSLQVKYASNPDHYKVVYFYNSNGKNIGRVGWEPTRWYVHGCGSDGFFNFLTERQTTDNEQTWTVSKSTTHLNIYVENVHLATIDFQANNCLDDYGGNVVSAVSFKYFATASGSWREKPISTIQLILPLYNRLFHTI